MTVASSTQSTMEDDDVRNELASMQLRANQITDDVSYSILILYICLMLFITFCNFVPNVLVFYTIVYSAMLFFGLYSTEEKLCFGL